MKYLDDYIHYLEIMNYSEFTISSYKIILFQFYDIFHEEYLKLQFQDFSDYISSLEEKGFSNYTLNKYVSVLKSFYRFLIQRKLLNYSDVFLLKHYKVFPRLDVISNKDLSLLLDLSNYSDDYFSIRNLLILELLYSTAIRVNELVNINLFDINLCDCKILIFGKGRKERYVLFGFQCKTILLKYLDIRKKYLQDNVSSYLLLNRKKEKMTTQSVRYVISKMSEKFKISKHLYPHLFRHTVASDLHKRGASTKTIQLLLGHSHIETTANYIYVSSDTIKNSYFKYHPRAREEK